MTQENKQLMKRKRGEFAQMLREDLVAILPAIELIVLFAVLGAKYLIDSNHLQEKLLFIYPDEGFIEETAEIAFWGIGLVLNWHLIGSRYVSTREARRPFEMLFRLFFFAQILCFIFAAAVLLESSFASGINHAQSLMMILGEFTEPFVVWLLGMLLLGIVYVSMQGVALGPVAAFSIPGIKKTLPLFWISILSVFTPTSWLAAACMPMHRQLVWLWKPRRLPQLPPKSGYDPPRGQS